MPINANGTSWPHILHCPLWGQLQISLSCKFCKQVKHLYLLTMGLYTYLQLLYFQILKRDFFQIRSFNIQGKNHINLIKFAQLCSFSICILLQSIIYSFQACQIIFRRYRMHRNKFWRCILIFTHLCFNEFFNEYSINKINILFMASILQFIFTNPWMFF